MKRAISKYATGGVQYTPSIYSEENSVPSTYYVVQPQYQQSSEETKNLPTPQEVSWVITHQEENPNSSIVEVMQKPTNYVEEKKGKIYKDQQEFVNDLKDAYSSELKAAGLSINYAPYLIAQDALESTWGASSLSEAYNFGGVKASDGVTKKTKEWDPKKGWYETDAKFRKFKNLRDYAKYKINLLKGSRYDAFANPMDTASSFYSRVKAGGYATDPTYVNKLVGVYNTLMRRYYGNNVQA